MFSIVLRMSRKSHISRAIVSAMLIMSMVFTVPAIVDASTDPSAEEQQEFNEWYYASQENQDYYHWYTWVHASPENEAYWRWKVEEDQRAQARASHYSDGTPDSNRHLGSRMAAQRGWTGYQWDCLNALWNKESGWNHRISNQQGSGAYGIPQALPGSKMGSHGSDWRTNPATQIAWGLTYIHDRYGTPCTAWSHSKRHNWY